MLSKCHHLSLMEISAVVLDIESPKVNIFALSILFAVCCSRKAFMNGIIHIFGIFFPSSYLL